jgi:hypothetical protein
MQLVESGRDRDRSDPALSEVEALETGSAR